MWKKVFCILGIILFGFGICNYTMDSQIAYPCVREYEAGQGNIQGDVDTEHFESIGEDFAIGANIKGYAVFKAPRKAYETMTELYDEGIRLIQEEFDLPPMTKRNYSKYGIYGWQVTSGTEEAKSQAAFVSTFCDIYENSFGGEY